MLSRYEYRIILWNCNFNYVLTFAYLWKTNIEMTCHSCPVSSNAMKHGPIITTLKQSKKVQPGGHCDHCGERRSMRLNLSAKWCSSFFLFFNECGIIYWHGVSSSNQGQKWTINSEYYCEVLKTLFTHIAKKRLELKKKFILHHDNTWPYTSSKMIAFLAKQEIEVKGRPLTTLNLSCTIFGSFCAWNPHFGDRDSTSVKQLLQWRILNSILPLGKSLPKC